MFEILMLTLGCAFVGVLFLVIRFASMMDDGTND
jgi:hypothetical protein